MEKSTDNASLNILNFLLFFYAYNALEIASKIKLSFMAVDRAWAVHAIVCYCFLIILAFIFMIFFYTMGNMKNLNNRLKTQVKMQKYYINPIESLYDEMRWYRDDIKNLILSIGY